MGLRTALYVIAMVVLIVAVDVLFLRNHVGPRLIVNVAIVVVFLTVYLIFLRRP
jgi:hypothetical protein